MKSLKINNLPLVAADIGLDQDNPRHDQKTAQRLLYDVSRRQFLPSYFGKKYRQQDGEQKNKEGGGGGNGRDQRHRRQQASIAHPQPASQIDQFIGGIDADHRAGISPE